MPDHTPNFNDKNYHSYNKFAHDPLTKRRRRATWSTMTTYLASNDELIAMQPNTNTGFEFTFTLFSDDKFAFR